MDNKSKSERTANMQAIHSSNTKPELIVRHLLFFSGYRYRLHVKSLPGKPDIVLQKWRTVIFVNGCFWHMHQDCPRATLPKSNSDFWSLKLIRNRERDNKECEALISMGWRVLVVWECACSKLYWNTLLEFIKEFISGVNKKAEIGRNWNGEGIIYNNCY